MGWYYIKLAVRRIRRQTLFSIINCLGLALGFAAVLCIVIYLHDELQHDTLFPDADDIYRIAFRVHNPDGEALLASSPRSLYRAIEQDSDLIQRAAAVANPQDAVVRTPSGNLFFEKSATCEVSGQFVSLFGLNFCAGDPSAALRQPGQVIISEQVANRYFGSSNPIGQSLHFDHRDWIINGVFSDFSQKSHFPPIHLIVRAPITQQVPDLNRDWMSVKTYIQTASTVDVNLLENHIRTILTKYSSEPSELDFIVQPLRSIHLYAHSHDEFEKPGNPSLLLILAGIGLVILLLAIINFISLAIAQAFRRFREIGIRKCNGAGRRNLVAQFTMEAAILTILAFLIAILFTELALPFLNDIAAKQLQLNTLWNPAVIGTMLSLMLLVISAVGLYPALYLSSFQPIAALHGRYTNLRTGFHNQWRQNGSILLQFTVSIVLLIVTLTIFRQIGYVNTRDLGFPTDQMLVLPAQSGPMARHYHDQFETIRSELTQHHAIESVTAQLNPPGQMQRFDTIELLNAPHHSQQFARWQFADEMYFPSYELPIIAGRNFDAERATDRNNAFIINETAVKGFGWRNPHEALGKRMKLAWFEGNIVGVVKDFHFESLHQPIGPLAYFYPADFFPESLTLKIRTGYDEEALFFIESQWESLFPDHPFEYFFIRDVFEDFYTDDSNLGKLLLAFSTLALLIAALGLFARTALMQQTRTKEVGIRKVLGASVIGLLWQSTKRICYLTLFAGLLAFPIAWWVCQRWLQNFAYHAPFSYWIFLYSGSIVLIIAVGTVSYLAIKAATANPVESLRYE